MFTNVVRRTVVANKRFMSSNPILAQREKFFSRNNVGKFILSF